MIVDLNSLPAGTPVWLVLGIVIASSMLVFSERAAKLKGPLGAAARWWEQRQQDEVDRLQSTDERIEAAAERRYGRRMAEMEKQIERLRADLEAERKARREERAATSREHAAELDRVRLDRDMFAAWSEHILAYWRAQSQWLAANGVQLPPPPVPTFAAFREEWLTRRT